MRLKPPVTSDEAFHLLLSNATMTWGPTEAALLHDQLRGIADAMAVISALNIPVETEPLFGEDIALDRVPLS